MSERASRWEGYSNYQEVSRRVSQSVDEAVESYTLIDRYHTENAQLPADLAAEASAAILQPALRLMHELEADAENVDEYQEILDRWKGEDGFITRFSSVELRTESPGWLNQFVRDIVRAAWELGYLQAGRRTKEDPEDETEAEAHRMFEHLS